MIDLKKVTIVGVAGTKAEETMKAIKYSMKEIEFGSAKLITPDEVYSEGVETIKCESLNYEQYNHFIVYRLHEYIDTEYALIVQNDGYVVNPYSWEDDFLNYDYIGAVWPLPTDNFSFRDPQGNIQRVGNGGFSLRSKKILQVASNLNLEWKPYYGFYHEDGFFSVHNRAIYELKGCIFAPIDVAVKFSQEMNVPENEGTIPFGFHGRNHYYYNLTQKSL